MRLKGIQNPIEIGNKKVTLTPIKIYLKYILDIWISISYDTNQCSCFKLSITPNVLLVPCSTWIYVGMYNQS